MRDLLTEKQIDQKALLAMESFHADIVQEVKQAIQSNKVVVVGMAQNPFVKKARKTLEENGIAFKYLEYGSYLSSWKKRLAIKLWSGWPTFPQVFVEGKLIGGFQETQQWLKSNKTQQQ